MRTDRIKAALLGLFLLSALALLTWLILFLRPSVGDGGTTLTIRATDLDRIIVGTRISFAGKPVGKVVKIRDLFDRKKDQRARDGELYVFELIAKVDSSIRIFTYDEICMTNQGLLGEKLISINPKAPPKGASPARDITNKTLYLKPATDFSCAINRFGNLAETANQTLLSVHQFVEETREPAKETLEAIREAAQEFTDITQKTDLPATITSVQNAAVAFEKTMQKTTGLVDEIQASQLVPHLSKGAQSLSHIAQKMEEGKGTLGRLLCNDSCYLQMTAILCKFEMLLSDMNQYGLLFQYNRRWQRCRSAKMAQMETLQTPQGFSQYCNHELYEIQASLDRVSRALCEVQSCKEAYQDPCFNENFKQLLAKIEALHENLKKYNESLYQKYCESCY